MRTGEHLVKKKMEEYQKNEIKIWETLRGMTDREIALSSVGKRLEWDATRFISTGLHISI